MNETVKVDPKVAELEKKVALLEAEKANLEGALYEIVPVVDSAWRAMKPCGTRFQMEQFIRKWERFLQSNQPAPQQQNSQ